MTNEKRLADVNALLEEIDRTVDIMGRRGDRISVRNVIMCVKNAPTVDAVEVIHGRWERYIDEVEDVHYYTCSVCNYMAIPRYNYCPNCGAKMDGGSYETD